MLHFQSIVPVLRVADVERSRAWYQDILGFAGELATPARGGAYCRLRRDDTELMLRYTATPSPRTPRRDGDWDVLLRLRGQALIALLDDARRRTPLVRGPEIMPDGNVEFELEDPDGHRVCVSEVLEETRGIPRALG